MVIAVLIGVPGVGYYLHTQGRFHVVKTEIKGDAPLSTVPRPGGAEPMVLTRTATPGGAAPEFLSATVLPGLGMGLLQITASLPGRGEVPLLEAPTVQALSDGAPGSKTGVNDLRGAVELPWSGALTGTLSPLGTSLTTSWMGRPVSVTRDAQDRVGVAEGGMLTPMSADTSKVVAQGAGSMAMGTFSGTDFGGHWPGKSDVAVSVALSAGAIELNVSATNVSGETEPMGIGWHPRFVIPSGDRQRAELRLPNGQVLEIGDRAKGTPTGKLVAADALARFQGRAAALGTDSLDASLVDMKPAGIDGGIAAELRDPASGFGLRIVAGSAHLKVLRVSAPAGARYVSLGTQTNVDDPLGKQWSGADSTGMVTLQPGQKLEWKVRLEIFPLGKHE